MNNTSDNQLHDQYLHGIEKEYHSKAMEAWRHGDAATLAGLIGEAWLFFHVHWRQLRATNMYESLLHVIYNGWCKRANTTPYSWKRFLYKANRDRLRKLGGAIPDKPITVYRGVMDYDMREFVRGTSWTSNPQTAACYACGYAQDETYALLISGSYHHAPAVYRLTVEPENIFYVKYLDGELEIEVDIWKCGSVMRLRNMPSAICHRPWEYRHLTPKPVLCCRDRKLTDPSYVKKMGLVANEDGLQAMPCMLNCTSDQHS